MSILIFCLGAINGLNSQHFIEISAESGIDHIAIDLDMMSGGLAFFDYNNDGFEDLYLTGGENADKFYENNGDGTFTDVTIEMNLDDIADIQTMGVVVGDINNDGYKDILVTTTSPYRPYLFLNVNAKFFREIGEQAGLNDKFYGSSAAMADYDLDGDLDIYIGEYVTGQYVEGFWERILNPSHFFYKNNGDNTFENIALKLSISSLGTALAVVFSDIDFDGDSDLLVANDFGYINEPNELFLNNFPNDNFMEISQEKKWDLEINSMGIACGDYDEDGDFDYYITDIGDNHLLKQNHDKVFLQSASSAGIADELTTSWGTAFFDYNNDGWLDLFVSNGPIANNKDELHANHLFEGIGDGLFNDVSNNQNLNSTLNSKGMSVGDFDNDGNLDIAVANVIHPDDDVLSSHALLYSNENETGNWAKVKLEGISSNRDGYGSRLKLVIGDRTLIREVQGGSSYLSSHSNLAHFGIGDESRIDSLIIFWPGKKRQVFNSLPVNKTFIVKEDGGIMTTISEVIHVCPGEALTIADQTILDEGIYKNVLESSSSINEIRISRVTFKDEEACLAAEDISTCYAIYPNPFNNELYLTDLCNQGGKINFSIFDILGRKVHSGSIQLDKRIDELEVPESLLPGNYILNVWHMNTIERIKIVKF